MFNTSDTSRNLLQLFGGQARKGYDWWWHSFTARDAETGECKPFFFEFFLCNPENGADVGSMRRISAVSTENTMPKVHTQKRTNNCRT